MSRPRINLVGQRFGQLTVLDMIHVPGKATRCSARCDCGTITEVNGYDLQRLSTKSCGCHRKRILDKTTHGLKRHRAYAIWYAMNSRCKDSSNPDFKNYGGRGICVRWIWHDANPDGLINFVKWFDSMNPSTDLSLDREDNNDHYGPGNCRFATAKQQAANKRPRKKNHES